MTTRQGALGMAEQQLCHTLMERLDADLDENLGLVGKSAAMAQLRDAIRMTAGSARPVLVTGPTGAGKELVVRAIHNCSGRRKAPLLEINCGLLTPTLIESELFGHERGAFTGAERRKEGLVSAAGSGSLFLDEIGELPFGLQAKLLRVLEAGSYRRLGATSLLRCEARVLAATHADLEQMVDQGSFREDLFYRLNVLEVRVPALVDRLDDLGLLVDHFGRQAGVPIAFTGPAQRVLEGYSWPGNVRQLRNVIDRLVAYRVCQPVDEATLAKVLPRSRPACAMQRLASRVLEQPETNKIAAMEQLLVSEAMRRAAGNRSAAARILGVHRKALERRLEKYGTRFTA